MDSSPAPRSTVIVHTAETRLSIHNGCLAVESVAGERHCIPAPHVGEILVFGSWSLTSPVLSLAARHRIAVSFFTHGGEWIGRLETADDEAGEQPAFDAVRAQWQLAGDEAAAGAFANRFIAGKIFNGRALLASIRGRLADPADRGQLAAAALALRDAARRLPEAESLHVLRGVEGAASRQYFAALARCITPELRTTFPFPRRSRRPPLDPFNAILSYLYSLLYHDCLTALRHVGLETRLGFLHARHPGRHSLACDLMEELRPLLADRLALALVNRRQLRAEHFTTDPAGGAVLLNTEGRRVLFAARGLRQREAIQLPSGDRYITWGEVPRHQAHLLATALRQHDPQQYEFFTARL
jgi:CRISPR-associated protein Cas1